MKTIRYWFIFLSAFLSRFKRLLLGSIVLGVLLFLFSSRLPAVSSLLQTGNTIGVVGKFQLNDLPSSIQQEISVGLTRLDKSNQAQPSIATSWESQEEGRVWIFHLGDYQWQDGTKIVAQDINYRFTDAEKQVIDDKTLKFTLKDPFAPFPTIVARPVFKKGLLGAGDWKVARLTNFTAQLSRSLTLENLQTREKKTYRFYDTEEAAVTAFKLGQVRQLVGVIDPRDLSLWGNARLAVQTHQDRYVGVFMNIQDEVLTDKNIRQALAYAINKEAFPERRATSILSPDSWAYNPQVKDYKYSVDHAKELLKTLPEEKRNALTVNLATSPSLLAIADKIKQDWEAIGIKTNLQVSNSPPEDFQALLAIQLIPPDPDQYSLWHSTQTGTNVTNYGQPAKESPRIDKLLEDGRRTMDQEQRKTIYYDFQRFLIEDLPVIPLFYPVTYTISRK